MCLIRGLVNRFRNQQTNCETDGVLEPDPRVVMAVLAVGMIVGALMTPGSAPTSVSAASAMVADARR
jgi:hypothetical protein